MKAKFFISFQLTVLAFLGSFVSLFGQAPLNDERIMLQGFYWESHRHGHPEKFPNLGNKKWYTLVKDNVDKIKNGHFDLVWLPPPSYAGDYSAGYGPKEYFNLNNSYGSSSQQRKLLKALLKKGIEPVADIVINHRDGTNGWVSFTKPAWDLKTICSSDEAFSNAASGVANTPIDQRGAAEEVPMMFSKTWSYQ